VFINPHTIAFLDSPDLFCYTVTTDRSVGHQMTRDDILDAAAQIIREKGYHATSMQDIAEAVDLRKASLYHHFDGKQKILVELLDMALDILIQELEGVVKTQIPPDEKLRLAMRSYLNSLAKYNDLASVLLLEHRSLEHKLRKKHIARRDRYEKLWRGIIEDGTTNGIFICDDPGLATKIVLGIANWTIMWYRQSGQFSADDIADQSADLILHGLCVR
jgi:AcrR family transcriptional regulator